MMNPYCIKKTPSKQEFIFKFPVPIYPLNTTAGARLYGTLAVKLWVVFKVDSNPTAVSHNYHRNSR